MLNVKYFAYGSNINIHRLKSRVDSHYEKITPGVPYVLQGYALIFNAGSKFGGWSFANIVPNIEASVEGILYDMTPDQFKELDRYEVLYHREYFRLDNNTIGCAYIANNDNTTIIPKKLTLDYLNIIIDGCLETGLSRTYKELLAYKKANYKLKKNKHDAIHQINEPRARFFSAVFP